MPAKPQELRSNKQLLDPEFQGYKLSLTEIPHHSYELPVAVHKLQHLGDQFSYLYLSLFSLQNHLVKDPWNEYALYYLNENSTVARIVIDAIDGKIEGVHDLLSVPSSGDKAGERCYNATLSFADHITAVVADGQSTLHIIHTGDRSLSEEWSTKLSTSPLGDDYLFTVLDARCVRKADLFELHCLLVAIVDDKDETSVVSRASTELHWIVFEKTGENDSWYLKNTFKINSAGLMKYAYFSPNCESLMIESTKPVVLPTDLTTKKSNESAAKKEARYYWQQSADDIKIWFGLPRDCVKDDIKIEVTNENLMVSVKSLVFLEGKLFQRLNADLTTWSISDNRAEIILWKHEEGLMWSYLVQEDNNGEEVVNAELVKEIHERLSHLCSENEALTDDTTPTFNPGQLEACDNAPEEDSRLVAINAVTKTVTHEVVLGGHQKLFNVRVSPDEAPLLCVRHDVDGTLWDVNCKRDELCQHVGTLKAFGYILASKQWKYSTCSLDFTYAVIAPTKQNLFIYKQNCSVNTELKNRKTGHSYARVGKQFLISLDTTEEILGLYASNNFLFTLTRSKCFIHRMKEAE